MTNDFKQECKKTAYKNRLGKIEYDDKSISNNDDLSSIEITDSCISNGEIIGNTNAKSIKISTRNNYNLADKDINAFIGVKYDDTTSEYIKIGKYTIDIPKDDKTAKNGEYDGINILSKLDEKYICGITDFSNCTVLDFYKDLCSQLNLTPKKLEFINKDIPVSGNPFTNNETCRTVLQNIAQVFCSFVNIDDETNEIDLIWFDEEISETFDKKDYSELERNQVYGPINSLSIKESAIEGENVVKEQDGKEIDKICIDGVLEQKTSKGNQLLDTSSMNADVGITSEFKNNILTITNDGIKVWQRLSKNIKELFQNNPGKTICFNYENLESEKTPDGTILQIAIYYNDGTATKYIALITKSFQRNSYTIPTDISNVESVIIAFFPSNNQTAMSNTLIITKPMLYFGNLNNPPEYEEYTGMQASPNPDYPQSIKVLEENFDLEICNKNLCQTNFNDWESGQYGTNGSKQSNTTRIRLRNLIKVIPNESYYVDTYSNKNFVFIFRTYDKNKEFIRSIGVIGDEESFNINTNEYFISVTIGQNTNSQLPAANFEYYEEYFKNGTIKPFICLNSEKDKSYELHQSGKCSFDLKNEFVAKLSDDIKDELYTEYDEEGNCHAYLKKKIGKAILNGSEDWHTSIAATDFYRYTTLIDSYISSETGPVFGKNTHFFQRINQAHGEYEYLYLINNDFKQLGCYIQSQNFTTLEEFKTWLSTNNVEVYYELANPYIVDLGIVEIPNLFKGSNYIVLSSTSNLGIKAKIIADYIGNEETYFGNNIKIEKEIYDLNEISIVDNYFLYTEELRKKAINGIWDRIKGFTYTDCKLTSYTGKPYLKRGNKIRIQDIDETYFDTYVLSHIFTYDGTFKSVIESPALTKTQTALKNKLSISGALRKVERTCNKIDGKITDVIEEVNGQENKITSVEQTVDSITQQVTNVSTNLTNDYLTSEQVNAMNSHNEETINQLKEEFNILKQTAENLSIEIGSVSTIGVDRVKTSTGFTFDENGLDISKTGEEMHNFIDNEGVYVKRNEEEVLGADASGVRAENITVRNYLVIGKNSRIEDYKDNRTGIFYIGDN